MPRFGEGFEGVPPCPKQGINLGIAVDEATLSYLACSLGGFVFGNFVNLTTGFCLRVI